MRAFGRRVRQVLTSIPMGLGASCLAVSLIGASIHVASTFAAAPLAAAPVDLDTPASPPGPVEVRDPPPAGDPPAAGAARAEAPAPRGNPLWSVPLESLSVTRERPIFSPARRPPAAPEVRTPPPAAPPAPPPAPVRPTFTLIGTVVSPSDGYGIFLDPATSIVVRLRTGDAHDGWVLRTVTMRDAMLQNGRATAVLALPTREGGAGAAPGGRLPDGSIAPARPVPGGMRTTAQRVIVPRRPPASPLEFYPDH